MQKENQYCCIHETFSSTYCIEEKLSSDNTLWNEFTTNLLACIKKYKYPFKALSKEFF